MGLEVCFKKQWQSCVLWMWLLYERQVFLEKGELIYCLACQTCFDLLNIASAVTLFALLFNYDITTLQSQEELTNRSFMLHNLQPSDDYDFRKWRYMQPVDVIIDIINSLSTSEIILIQIHLITWCINILTYFPSCSIFLPKTTMYKTV